MRDAQLMVVTHIIVEETQRAETVATLIVVANPIEATIPKAEVVPMAMTAKPQKVEVAS